MRAAVSGCRRWSCVRGWAAGRHRGNRPDKLMTRAQRRQATGLIILMTSDAILTRAELTNMLVNGLLATRAAAAAAGSGGGGSKQPHRSASRVAESERLADAQEEAEGLRVRACALV